MGVVVWDVEYEFICGILPKARVGCYGYFKEGEIVGVGEFNVGYFTSIKFGNICFGMKGNERVIM